MVIPNGRLTIAEGAIRPYNRINMDNWYVRKLQAVGERHGFSLTEPTAQISEANLQRILYGTGDEIYKVSLGHGRAFNTTYEGVIPNLERRHKETESDFMRRDIERFMQEKPCTACGGLRLKPEVLAVTVSGHNIMEICNLSIDEAVEYFQTLNDLAAGLHGILKEGDVLLTLGAGSITRLGPAWLEGQDHA